jgi:cytidine deaminase
MENIQFVIDVEMRSYDELSESDRMLIDAAKEATSRSYAPYSHFFV